MSTQLFIGKMKPSPKRIKPITYNMLDSLEKPHGGIWTSTWCEDTQTSEWVEYLLGGDYRDPYSRPWWLVIPNEQTRIYTVNTFKDLKRLTKRYPGPNFQNIYAHLDYEAIAKDYDAIHLTSEGQWATRSTYPENLNGWSCESTIWFRWCFSEVTAYHTKEERSC